jgi:hypothetical protein
MDVTLLVNSLPFLIGFGDFEWNESTADGTGDPSLRRVFGTCHDMVLLAD